MSRTITFQPGKELGEFIEALIRSGDYQNQSEVIRDGLRLLREKQARSKLQELRRLIDEGDASGEPVAWKTEKFLSGMKKKNHGRPMQTPTPGKKGS